MDCDTARDLLAFRRPGGPAELAPTDAAALDQHLADCPACAETAARRTAFDAAVAAAMKAVPVPADLRAAVIERTTAAHARQFRRKVATWAAAVAAVVVAGVLAYGVRRATQPVFDAEGFAWQQDQAADAPDRAVAEWLRQQGLPPELPLPFDFRHYAFHGTQPVNGKNVPVVVFQTSRPNHFRPDTLRVFLIRDGDFRFDGLRDAVSSLFTARILKDDRDENGVVYLALTNAADLTPFLMPPRPHQ